MNLQVTSMSVFANPFKDCLDINCSMSRPQMERAIRTLLGQFTKQDAAAFLRSEFPQLFTTTETTA